MNFRTIPYLLAFLFFSTPLAWADSEWQRLAEPQKKQWQRILHFEGGHSAVVTESFFVSKQGPRDPAQEFTSSVKLLESQTEVSPEGEVFSCRFPLRARFIRAALGRKFPELKCPSFEGWKEKFSTMRVDLIFASSFLGNPASSFGHTLFRFVRRGADGKPRHDLLSYGVSYGANITTEQALLYAFNGTFGIFMGYYSVAPYYEKLREYNYIDNRDLWEYELNLTQEQIDKMVEHLWEILPTQMRYYFFSRNCSYQLLAFLEAVDARFELVSQLPAYVIPLDTIRILNNSGLVKKFGLRISQEKSILEKWRQLDPISRYQVALAREQQRLKGDESMAALELLSAVNLVSIHKDSENAALQKFQDEVLENRKRFPPAASYSSPVQEQTEGPQHYSQQHALLGGFVAMPGANAGLLGFRGVEKYWLESRLDREQLSELVLVDFRLRVGGPSRIALAQMDLIRASTMVPANIFFPHMAWRMELGAQERSTSTCEHCLVGRFGAELGKNWGVLDSLFFYGLLGVRGELEAFRASRSDLGLTNYLGLIFAPSKKTALSVEGGPAYMLRRHLGVLARLQINQQLLHAWMLLGSLESERYLRKEKYLGKLELGYRF